MQVGTQALGNFTFNRHLMARAHQKGKRKRALLVGLTLTSMVDMFSLLVIFLLQTFSTSPELLAITKGVTLPVASTGQELKDAPVLSISTDGVYLDQKLLGTADAVLKNPEPLLQKLGDLRELWQKAHPKEKFKGELSLQAHKELSSTLVARFMGLLPSQHYGSIQLAVVSK